MKLIYTFFIFLSITVITEACAQKINIEDIYGIWYRSYEDDSNDTIVYRSKGYKFPPIRAREKMEILKHGEIIESRVSPSDAYLKVRGKFSYCEKHNRLVFTFTYKDNKEERKYKIIELNKSIFKIQYVREDKSSKKP